MEVMAMKLLANFPKAPGLESHYQMQFSVISRKLVGGGGLTTCRSEIDPGARLLLELSQHYLSIYLSVTQEE